MVLLDTRHDRSSIPAGISALRSSGSVGNTIPMVFVTNPDGTQGIEGVSYVKLRDDLRGAQRDLRKAIEEAGPLLASASSGEMAASEDKGETTASEPAPALLAESQEWSNTEGRTITAAVERIDGGAVRFLMPDGSAVDYPIANLSEESRERLAKLSETE